MKDCSFEVIRCELYHFSQLLNLNWIFIFKSYDLNRILKLFGLNWTLKSFDINWIVKSFHLNEISIWKSFHMKCIFQII